MSIDKVINIKNIEELFAGWQETMIYSCLQGYMGEAYATTDYQSSLIVIADFCFFAGVPSKALLKMKVWGDFAIMVPQSDGWASLIEEIYPNATKRERYATRKDIDCFDKDKLRMNIAMLSHRYQLKSIDETIYHQLLKHSWSYDLCGQFQTYQDYQKRGIGFVIMEEQDIIAGVSSYTVYNEGVEIEIDTREDKRSQGLARVCASQMILECLDRGLYPSWDAHNLMSLNLANSLGYIFDKSYFIYEFINK